MKIILGSKSSGRKYVLQQAGYVFDIMTADIDEKAIRSDNYEELPLLIARAKAKALQPKISEPAILITGDGIVMCNGQMREKPENEEQARVYLESYNHHPAITYMAIVATNTSTSRQAEGLDISKVYFKHLPIPLIEKLIKDGKVLQAAGAFMTEHPLMSPYIDHIIGDRTGVIGLPLKLMEELIKKVSLPGS